jgi:GH25 family lysozyme M1 (1,4-beta-N-acetylmuramidase)
VNLKSLFHSVYLTLNPTVVTPRAHGIDLSKYDLKFIPENAVNQLDFAIQRVSYRTTRDEAFTTLLPGVMQVPVRGSYHYLNSDTDWLFQADRFLTYVRGYDYHFFVCDFEGAFNILSTAFAYSAWRWIDFVRNRTGKPVFLYTSPALYNQYIYPSQRQYNIDWNNIPLWQAQWFYTPNANGSPSTPLGRTAGWKLWQYTDRGDGTLYGAGRTTACDLDVWNGTIEEMREYLGVQAIGGEVADYIGVVNTDAKVWNDRFVQIDSLPARTAIRGSGYSNDGIYFRLTSPVAGWTKKIWVTVEPVVTPPPPPPPDDEPTPKYTILVYPDGSITINGTPYP